MFAHAVNGFKHCYLTLIISFNTIHFFVHRLNVFKHCYLTLIISFNTIHFFVHRLNVFKHCYLMLGGARGLMVIVAGCGHGDTSSNPGPD